MPRVSQVIHQYGRPTKAKLLNGDMVERQEKIYIPSYQSVFPTLDYDTHFVYYIKQMGSTLMCTCGSPAAVFSYDAYEKYCSYMGEKVIGCISHLQNGVHGDGSH